MKQPDWSTAPEGATHYSPYPKAHNPFLMLDNGVWYWYNDRGWERYGSGSALDRHLNGIIPRPTTPQWNGEGLPPVGVVCEVRVAHSNSFYKCRVEWMDETNVLIRNLAENYVCKPIVHLVEFCTFRPARTPEQIAAEEREVAVQEMCVVAGFPIGAPEIRCVIRRLYDHGCRMTAEDER